jgi:uncharacterized membrane protein YdbT with pleckstrin-like domain
MPSYVEQNLIKDERVLYVARVSLWTEWRLIALGLVLLAAFGLGLVFLVAAWVRYRSTELAVTSRRVVAKFGFVSRRTIEMNLAKVETVQVEQSVAGRLFDFGSLIISGAGIPQEPIPGISQPMEFRRRLLEAQDGARAA